MSNVKKAVDKHGTNEAARKREARALAMARARLGLEAAVAGVEAAAAASGATEAEAMEAGAAAAGDAEAGAAAVGDGGGETKSQEGGWLGAEGGEAECLADQVDRLEAENAALGAAAEDKDARINDLVTQIKAMTMAGAGGGDLKRSREE